MLDDEDACCIECMTLLTYLYSSDGDNIIHSSLLGGAPLIIQEV